MGECDNNNLKFGGINLKCKNTDNATRESRSPGIFRFFYNQGKSSTGFQNSTLKTFNM